MLMCFVGSAQAQRAWDAAANSVEENEFHAGAENYYVLQEGDNTKEDGTSDGHSASHYLTGKQSMSDHVTHDCIFNFIEVGKNSQGYTTYVLKNLASGLFLANTESRYVKTQAEAYKFTVRKAVAKAESEITNESTFDDYSNAVSATRSVHAVELGAWVLCHESQKEYIGFVGAPNFAGWIDTNNWLIKVATERELSAQDKLLELFAKYFENGVSEELYPIGTNPGCVSKDFYDRLTAVYNTMEALTGQGAAADEAECLKAIEDVNAIMAEYETAMVPVGPGYFVAKNVGGRGFLTVTGDGTHGRGNTALKGDIDYNEWTPELVTAWNLQNAKYIWQVEAAKEKGKILLKNFGTGQYLSTNSDYVMVDENGSVFTPNHFSGVEFTLTFGSNGMVHVANHSNNKLLNYNDPNDAASRWKFYTIGQDVIDSLSAKVAQQAMNEKLAALVKNANSDILSVQLKNGFVNNGFYNHPSDTGLVRDLLGANANDPEEGSVAEMFDGKMNTYYHTSWHTSLAPEGNHWVSVDLGHPVTELIVKFSQRHNAHNGDPRMFKLMAPENDDYESEVWPIELASTPDTIEYDLKSELGDSTTYIGKFQLSQPSRYVRFVVTATTGNQFPAGQGSGPCWHVSELRFYDAAECVDNPKFLLVPEEVRTALTDAIAAATKEVEEGTAKETTYDALEEALKNFWDAYPNPSELLNDLETASEMAAKAKENEGEGLAQFTPGAGEELETVVNRIKGEIEGKDLSLEQIEKYQAELDAAINLFNSKLHVPETGKIYRMVCVAPSDANMEKPHAQWGACVASANADINANPVWRYQVNEASERFNTLWLAEKDEQGFTFKNLANGFYLNNPYDGLTEEEKDEVETALTGYSLTPKHFTLEAATVAENAFLITFTKGQYLNFDPNGNVVHYYDRNDQHALFTFEDVAGEATFSSSYYVDVNPGQTQILTLPIAVEGVFTNQAGAYRVLGIKDNKIHLELYPEGEVIPAGTPFIIQTEGENAEAQTENETHVEALLASENLSDFLNLEYVYEPIVQNGLVSAPRAFDTEEPYGVLVNGVVIPAEKGTRIAAASGFINKDIPAYTEDVDGEFIITIEGEIAGEGTGVENVGIVKNVASDVYTVSGVKVRQNVKASAATKGLPKGVYIVGGKKVIVK